MFNVMEITRVAARNGLGSMASNLEKKATTRAKQGATLDISVVLHVAEAFSTDPVWHQG